ncbi:MAG: hypothetical protein XU15_C0011G0027 [candidate division NC10 bacterium CSP1-5]|nr:MAG: hypothetical protein XU15_C0011G0027 [candidate division NC10 bacterium CSP1-5]
METHSRINRRLRLAEIVEDTNDWAAKYLEDVDALRAEIKRLSAAVSAQPALLRACQYALSTLSFNDFIYKDGETHVILQAAVDATQCKGDYLREKHGDVAEAIENVIRDAELDAAERAAREMQQEAADMAAASRYGEIKIAILELDPVTVARRALERN